MSSFLIILFVTLILSSTSVWIIKKIAIKFSVFDVPNERSSHTIPTPRFGGVGVIMTLIIVGILFYSNELLNQFLNYPLIFFGFFTLIAISFYDDLKTLSSKLRFFIHFLFSMAIIFSEIVFTRLDFVFLQVELNYIWAFVLSSFFLIACINIYNFMDGIDGYAGGVGSIASIAFAGFYFVKGQFIISEK